MLFANCLKIIGSCLVPPFWFYDTNPRVVPVVGYSLLCYFAIDFMYTCAWRASGKILYLLSLDNYGNKDFIILIVLEIVV